MSEDGILAALPESRDPPPLVPQPASAAVASAATEDVGEASAHVKRQV